MASKSRNALNGKGKKATAAREASMAELKAQIAALLQQRMSYADIAAKLGISTGTVQNYRKTILAEWRESSAGDANELFTTIFSEYAFIRNEALAAWERSKLNKETETTKETGDGIETTSKSEGQAGDASFLAQAQKALDSMRALRGMDAPKKIEQTNIDGGEAVPKRVKELLDDPNRLAAELEADAKHLE